MYKHLSLVSHSTCFIRSRFYMEIFTLNTIENNKMSGNVIWSTTKIYNELSSNIKVMLIISK